uniref:Secreted protein n=1 Tax=Streptomyces sp. NBC_00003 TaxID=2903608 RepID=A0AAU2UZG2_9ACTN
MNDDVRNIVLGVLAAGISAALGWVTRTYLWKRKLRRKQAFFGLPDHAECLLVVNRAAGHEVAVHRFDVFALLELSSLIKDCGAHAQIIQHDLAQQGFGERTEFCLGGPYSNRRMAAHLASLLPGVKMNVDSEPSPDRGAFQIGSERYRLENGVCEYVILARLTPGRGSRPVFLFCGQSAITNQAATRYLARNSEKLARKHGNNSFCLLLKVVNSHAYGPDVVELVADVTRAAQEPAPAVRTSHRAGG